MRIHEILKEYTDPEGQFSTVAAPADPTPKRSYAIRLIGLPQSQNIKGAKAVWEALSGVLPRDYPPGDASSGGRAQELVGKLVTTKRPQIIKQGLTKDMAETIAMRIENYHGNVRIPVDTVEQG
jgi:hypothetical protein